MRLNWTSACWSRPLWKKERQVPLARFHFPRSPTAPIATAVSASAVLSTLVWWALNGRFEAAVPFIGVIVGALVGTPIILYLHQVILDLAASREQLAAASLEAEVSNRSKSAFLANMSHELRTPLNAIIGFSDVMAGQKFGPLGSERYVQYVNDIRESGRHLLGLITDVLDISKVESGTIILSEDAVRLTEIVRTCARLLRDRMEAAGVQLELDISEHLPVIWADPRRLKQVFLNLMGNASKFTDRGGRVSVRANTVPDGIAVVIADTGIGMGPDDLKTALTPFGQVESSLSRRHSGTGLGLPLAKSLIELHGGRMTIESEPGKGTRVILLLPQSRIR